MRPIIALVLLLGVLLTACTQPLPFKGSDISQTNIGGDFTLTDHHGKQRTLADFKGKVVVLFFGYTACPDVCPTTMSELKTSMKELGAAAKDVQVLFISVDPARDTPALLSQYVPAFNPSFLGLTGSDEQISAVTKKFRAIYQKQGQGNAYTVDHTAGSYLIDRSGQTRVLVNYGAGAATFTHDIQLLLAD
jgi:protein SCO1/2